MQKKNGRVAENRLFIYSECWLSHSHKLPNDRVKKQKKTPYSVHPHIKFVFVLRLSSWRKMPVTIMKKKNENIMSFRLLHRTCSTYICQNKIDSSSRKNKKAKEMNKNIRRKENLSLDQQFISKLMDVPKKREKTFGW